MQQAIARGDAPAITRLVARLGGIAAPGLRERRLLWAALAAGALQPPRAGLRRLLLEHVPTGQRRGLRLRGEFDAVQGLQNPGGLLSWRLEDAQGHCHLAAIEKVVPTATLTRHVRDLWTDRQTEWLKEAYFYLGLRRCEPQTGCHLPTMLGLRRGPGRLGLLLRDLRHEGWSVIAADDVPYLAPVLASALVDFACDYRLPPPADSPRWHMPYYRPFFIRLDAGKYENFARALALADLPGQQCATLLDRMRSLDQGWESRLRQAALPQMLCHGDPHFRNMLIDAQGRVTLLDMENYFFGPPGLDIGRFIGTSITRVLETLTNTGDPANGISARHTVWTSPAALEQFAQSAERAYLDRLRARGIQIKAETLRQLSRNTAALSIFYAPVAWRRMAEAAPELVRPALGVLEGWTR